MEGLISERAYNRNRKSAIKQDIAVLIKIFLHLLRTQTNQLPCIKTEPFKASCIK